MCYCEHCRAQLPGRYRAWTCRARRTRRIPARRAYILWQQQRLFELWQLWDAEIRKINPGARFIANSGGGALSDARYEDASASWRRRLFADRQARRGLDAAVGERQERQGVPRHAGPQSRSAASSASGVEEPYRWKDSVQSEAEIRIWVADGIANGLRPWFTKFSRHAPRPALAEGRWRRSTRWHCRWERYLRNEAPWRAWPWSTRSRRPTFYGGAQAARRVEDHIARLLPRAGRGAHPVRDGARPAAGCGAPRPVQDADPAQHRGAVGRAVRAAARRTSQRGGSMSRPSRRRSTTNGASGAPTSAWRTCSACASRRRWRARCRIRTCASRTTRHGPAPPPAGGAGRRGAHHQRRAPRRGEADAGLSPARR